MTYGFTQSTYRAGGWHNPHVQYAPVGYTFQADIYCLECTSKTAHAALAEYAAITALCSGKHAYRNDSTRETWFLRGNKVIAKRYNRRGRCVSKRIIVHDVRAAWVECCTECHLDQWAKAYGLADRMGEWSFDSGDFPKHIAYHGTCGMTCGDVGCEDQECSDDCPDDCDREHICDGQHHEQCGSCGADICDV